MMYISISNEITLNEWENEKRYIIGLSCGEPC